MTSYLKPSAKPTRKLARRQAGKLLCRNHGFMTKKCGDEALMGMPSGKGKVRNEVRRGPSGRAIGVELHRGGCAPQTNVFPVVSDMSEMFSAKQCRFGFSSNDRKMMQGFVLNDVGRERVVKWVGCVRAGPHIPG